MKESFQAENKEVNIMKYAVVSYYVGETGDTELWLYDTENEAIKALNRLWKQSYNLALKDEDFAKIIRIMKIILQ